MKGARVETNGIWKGRVKIKYHGKTIVLTSDGRKNYSWFFECKEDALSVTTEGVKGDLLLRISRAEERADV